MIDQNVFEFSVEISVLVSPKLKKVVFKKVCMSVARYTASEPFTYLQQINIKYAFWIKTWVTRYYFVKSNPILVIKRFELHLLFMRK